MSSAVGTCEDIATNCSSGWINLASSMAGCERIEAFFSGQAYRPHRHDTYAIGRTISGVQRFHYRGMLCSGLPGNAMIIHPDEKHDGQAGTEEGFRYRMIYLDPALVQSALGGQKSLPFVPHGVSSDPRLLGALDNMISCLFEPMEELQFDDAIFDLAHALQDAAASGRKRHIETVDYKAANLARDYILQFRDEPVSLDKLEEITAQNRWKLSRDFRAVFGTSPYRYSIMRRLDIAKFAITKGQSIVQAANEAGFADQSHFTRHFCSTFGISPARWRKLALQ